ncbi:long-chain fatty acid-CoA ligase [Ascosphaera acerosa]|nr:long-chain fatty acid-CoA ligase [Ascosphaera acerosa]
MHKGRLIAVPEPDPSIRTIYDVVQFGVRTYGNAKCMAYRDLIKVHKESKKVPKVVDGKEELVDKEWTFFELSPYKWLTYYEYEQLMLQVGSALRRMGLEPGDRVHLYASTSHRWLSVMHGATSQSMPVVTSYETLGLDALKHSIQATKPKLLYTESNLLKGLPKVLGDTPSIAVVVYNKTVELDAKVLDKLVADFPDIQFLPYEEFRAAGEANMVDPVKPSPEDLCCIMYTSGSTGTPKGVMLRHKQFVASIAGATAVVMDFLAPSDIFINYLPLAHIFELMVETSAFIWGTKLGYGHPRTLTSQSVRNCKGDLEELHPTIMVGVPAVWEATRKGIAAKVDEGGAVVKRLFSAAYYAKKQLLQRGLPGTGVIDNYILKKVKQATGGKLRWTMSGAGPIASQTMEFISVVLAPLINGYGLTETIAMASLRDPMWFPYNTRGDIPPCIEVKLVDFAEAGYTSKDKPFPRGEIWIRGPAVMEGYFENEEETKSVLTPDGWFMTGDIGMFDETGKLRVIDRKKSLVKTLKGEYVALEKLESIYRVVSVVGNICVYADGDREKPIALVVPNGSTLEKLAADNGIQTESIDELLGNRKLKNIVLREMQAVGRKYGLAGIEIIHSIVLVDEEWTPENGLTTAAGKLQRRALAQKYSRQIEEAYQDTDGTLPGLAQGENRDRWFGCGLAPFELAPCCAIDLTSATYAAVATATTAMNGTILYSEELRCERRAVGGLVCAWAGGGDADDDGSPGDRDRDWDGEGWSVPVVVDACRDGGELGGIRLSLELGSGPSNAPSRHAHTHAPQEPPAAAVIGLRTRVACASRSDRRLAIGLVICAGLDCDSDADADYGDGATPGWLVGRPSSLREPVTSPGSRGDVDAGYQLPRPPVTRSPYTVTVPTQTPSWSSPGQRQRQRQRLTMPAPSLLKLAQAACVRYIKRIDDIGDAPYELFQPVLQRIENPEHLHQLEVKSPHLAEHTAELWHEFIKRDVPRSVASGADKTSSGSANGGGNDGGRPATPCYAVYRELVDRSRRQFEDDAQRMFRTFQRENKAKERLHTQIVADPRRRGARAARARARRRGLLAAAAGRGGATAGAAGDGSSSGRAAPVAAVARRLPRPPPRQMLTPTHLLNRGIGTVAQAPKGLVEAYRPASTRSAGSSRSPSQRGRRPP